MKRRYSGLTLIEILTVAGIIIVLVGLLIPATTMVRKAARETKQRAELNTIALAITTFKNDYGDYPPSDYGSTSAGGYCGAQKLTEALCGWDLLGFDPNSHWRSDGEDGAGNDVYPTSLNLTNPDHVANLRARRGPYLDMANISVFQLGQLFNSLTGGGLTLADTYVLCDVFGVRNAQVGNKNVKAGTPILYYRANQASKIHNLASASYPDRIYNVDDNHNLVALRPLTPTGALSAETHPIDGGTNYANFYEFITDPRATAIPWPYKPDSYILISAGADGQYGTRDDICNF